jgi:hypothetical protein
VGLNQNRVHTIEDRASVGRGPIGGPPHEVDGSVSGHEQLLQKAGERTVDGVAQHLGLQVQEAL